MVKLQSASRSKTQARGLRAVLYRLSGRVFGERLLPVPIDTQSAASAGWTADRLLDVRRWSRYYTVSNGLRMVAYLPVLVAAWQIDPPTVSFAASMTLTFHGWCLLIERAKMSVVREYCRLQEWLDRACATLDPISRCSDVGAARLDDPYTLFDFETSEFYRSLGLEWVRRRVQSYTEWAQLSRAERIAGTHVLQVGRSPAELMNYAAKTRRSERLHALGGFMNLGLIIGFGDRSDTTYRVLCGYLALMVIFDACLVLLQRYHRSRIQEVVARHGRSRRGLAA